MSVAKELCSIINIHLRDCALSGSMEEKMRALDAIAAVGTIFDRPFCGSAQKRVDDLYDHVWRTSVQDAEYTLAIEMLRKYEIIPPPLVDASDDSDSIAKVTQSESSHHQQTSPGDKVFMYLATDKEVPEHKIKMICGILGLKESHSSVMEPLCCHLYEKHTDDARMQLILKILQAQVQ